MHQCSRIVHGFGGTLTPERLSGRTNARRLDPRNLGRKAVNLGTFHSLRLLRKTTFEIDYGINL
jgi:hypothetical protein